MACSRQALESGKDDVDACLDFLWHAPCIQGLRGHSAQERQDLCSALFPLTDQHTQNCISIMAFFIRVSSSAQCACST